MAQALTIEGLSTVLVTGLLPPLLWLWFWLKEDTHKEPKGAIMKSFVLGMASVPIVLLLEYAWCSFSLKYGFVQNCDSSSASGFASLWLLAPWAFIEEVSKFSVAWWADLRRSIYEEPIDAIIYLITVALGFAAMENVLFLLKTLNGGGGLLNIVATADLRFIGATILHTVASGIVGVSIAFTFFHPEIHARNIWGGLILATVLHTAFNKFIIGAGSPNSVFQAFFTIWTLALILIFFFEKVKRLKPQNI